MTMGEKRLSDVHIIHCIVVLPVGGEGGGAEEGKTTL